MIDKFKKMLNENKEALLSFAAVFLLFLLVTLIVLLVAVFFEEEALIFLVISLIGVQNFLQAKKIERLSREIVVCRHEIRDCEHQIRKIRELQND